MLKILPKKKILGLILIIVILVMVSACDRTKLEERRENLRASRTNTPVRDQESITPPTKTVESNHFNNPSNWEAYDAGNIGGLQTKGYFGVVSDGRYIYYAPCRQKDFHGIALRYDSSKDFKSSSSWESYDAGNTDDMNTIGYSGAIFDGRYVYYVPFAEKSTRHARVLRYDTLKEFDDSSAWTAFDGMSVAGKGAMGYDGAIFDGKYIYFVPFGYDPYAHALVLRFDTTKDFKDKSSWNVYDASNTDGLVTKGYYGGGFDDRYVYFVPFNDGKDFQGRVLRYNTKENFNSASSWEAIDVGNLEGKNTVGYKGASYDGRYMYFVPFRDKDKTHGLVLRYDTEKNFKDTSSWDVYDASNTDGLPTMGFVGAVSHGKYVYFIPYSDNKNVFHSNFLRYDTTGDFNNALSWDAYDASDTDGLNTKGYKYGVFSNGYLYPAPYNNNQAFSGIALRYKVE